MPGVPKCLAKLHQRSLFGVGSSSRFTGKIHNKEAMMLLGGFEVLNLFSYLTTIHWVYPSAE